MINRFLLLPKKISRADAFIFLSSLASFPQFQFTIQLFIYLSSLSNSTLSFTALTSYRMAVAKTKY